MSAENRSYALQSRGLTLDVVSTENEVGRRGAKRETHSRHDDAHYFVTKASWMGGKMKGNGGV